MHARRAIRPYGRENDGLACRRSATNVASSGSTARERAPRRRRSGLRDANEVARRVAERAVACTPGLRRRLLQHLGARRAHLLERCVEVVGAEDRGLERTPRDEALERVAFGLRTAAVRLRQDDVEVLARGS